MLDVLSKATNEIMTVTLESFKTDDKELREERDNSDSFAARYKEYYEKYSLS